MLVNLDDLYIQDIQNVMLLKYGRFEKSNVAQHIWLYHRIDLANLYQRCEPRRPMTLLIWSFHQFLFCVFCLHESLFKNLLTFSFTSFFHLFLGLPLLYFPPIYLGGKYIFLAPVLLATSLCVPTISVFEFLYNCVWLLRELLQFRY